MKLTSLLVLLLPSLIFGIPDTWNSLTTYPEGKVVLYTPSGSSEAKNYIALQSGAGQQPDTSSAFWSLLENVASGFTPPPGDPSTFEEPSLDSLPTSGPPDDTPYFFGISCRAYIDDAPMVGGLTIKGTESKKILIRAKGPSMSSLLPGKKLLPNPKIKVQKLNESTNKYETVLQTWDYGDHASFQEYASEATGNDVEPMVVTTLEPGVYSIKVQDETSGETGNVNLEIYEVSEDNSSSTFFGLSGRAFIDDAPMVGGLTIKGTESKKVLIRAKGPSMASLLPGKQLLANPKIKVQKLNDSTNKYETVLQTWDYGDHTSFQEYASEATGNDVEPMVVTTLEPGVYSIKVQDETSGGKGNTNLEIYAID